MLSLLANVPNASHNSELDQSFAQFRDQTRFWIQRVAVPIILVIGLFGNLITVIIMTRRRMRSTTNMYLAALAFVDMFYLLLTFLLGLSHYPNMAGTKYYAYWQIRPFLMMLTDACSNTSVWLIVTFTIERYIAVKYPMKGKVWCTEERAKKLIFGVVFFGILFASPVPFEWKVIERQIPNNDSQTLEAYQRSQSTIQPTADKGETVKEISQTTDTRRILTSLNDDDSTQLQLDWPKSNLILALDYSDFGRNETYKTIYYWSTAVIFYFIPLFSLILFNGFLIKSVHQSQKERNKMTTHQGPTKNVISASISSTPIITITNKNNPSKAIQASSLMLPLQTTIKPQTRQILSMPRNSTEAFNGEPGISKFSSESNNLPLLTDRTNQLGEHNQPQNQTASNESEIDEKCDASEDNLRNLQCQIDCYISDRDHAKQDNYSHEKPIFQVGWLDGEKKDDSEKKTELSQKLGTEQKQPGKTDIISGRHDAAAIAELTRSFGETCLNSRIEDDNIRSGSRIGASDGAIAGESISMIDGRTVVSLKDKDVVHAVDRPSKKIYGYKQVDVQNSCDKTMEQKGVAKQSVSGVLVTTNGVKSTTRRGQKCPLRASIAIPTQKREHNRLHNYKNSNAQNILKHEACSSSLNNFAKMSSQASLRIRSHSYSSYGGSISNQERRITIMLIAVVILFLVCQIPSAAMLLYTSVHETIPNTNEHALLLAFGNIFNFLMAVNAAGNFILYSFLSEKYRKTFVLLFCNCYRRNITHDSFGQGSKRHASVRFVSTLGVPQKGAVEASLANSAAI